ncbi:hypothetical protein BH24ACI3_BH24ACI3_00130 [soil metagenome]
MTSQRPPKKRFLERIAEENGVAVVVWDKAGNEVAAANNNSICRSLLSSVRFSARCDAFCGKAFDSAWNAGKSVEYVCHAGLACAAVPVQDSGTRFVAITGRTFTSSEGYRAATEKAVSGEWKAFSPTEFFENVLISGSATPIEHAATELAKFMPKGDDVVLELDGPAPKLAEHAPSAREPRAVPEAVPVPVVTTEAIAAESEQAAFEQPPAPTNINRLIEKFNRDAETSRSPKEPDLTLTTQGEMSDVAATRSLISSLMEMEYAAACQAVLNHLATRFGGTSYVWLELKDETFKGVASVGELRGRSIRINVRSKNAQLLDHAKLETPLELSERRKDADAPGRSMLLFPVQVGTQVRAAIGIQALPGAVVGNHEISRFAKIIGPQIEILRLRHEVSSREWVSQNVRRFNEGLRGVDQSDFWRQITETSAELLGAERASLLVRTEGSEELSAKASVGSVVDLEVTSNVGSRIARVTLERGSPILVSDVEELGVDRAPNEWRYKTSSFISFPITIGDRRLAVMNFTDRADGNPFGENDLELLQTIAPQIAVAIDHGQLKVRAGELERRSITDSLTGLMNRGYIEERLIEEMNQASRRRSPMSLLMIDVDNFKSYNDTFGHPAGDIALVLVANVLKDTLRAADVAARYGGEEFAVLLPQTAAEEGAAIAERLRQRVERSDFPKRRITVSVGIAAYSTEFVEPKDWITAADMALYEAKDHGRNVVRNYEDLGRSYKEKIY